MEYHRSSTRTVLKSLTAAVCHQGWRIFHRVVSGVETLFEGFWLGILPDSVIDVVSERSYGEGANYTGPEYLDSGFQFWEEIAVSRFFPAGGKVLVAAAGGGREVIALARAGFVSAGFECSRAMVSAGKRAFAERGLDNRLEWAPPCQVPEGMLQDEYATWDAAIVGWNGYTYISPRRRRIAFLRSLRDHLRYDSPILVSVAIRASHSGAALWTPRVANAVRRLTFRRPEFATGSRFPGHPRHGFSRPELEAELVEAGFSPVAYWRWGPFAASVALRTKDNQIT